MKNWKRDVEYFFQRKVYWLVLGLTALGGYGYLITHGTVGIDDTPFRLYFSEGLSAYVGRWVIYMLGRAVFLAEYAPFLTDLAGVLLLAAAAVVFSVLARHILGDAVPFYGYLFFACFLVANPIWAEVFVYFLHNGVGLGYLFLGISLCFAVHAAEQTKRAYLPSALFLWLAVGCYESMMVAWLTGFLLLMLARRYAGCRQRVIPELLAGAAVMAGAMALRTVWLPVFKAVFGLNRLREVADTRSVTEMINWIGNADRRADFVMALKRAYVMYGVFACAYYPILMFVLAAAVILITGVCRSLRRKEGWSGFLSAAALASCFLLIPIEGKVTLYRSAQFLPLVSAFGVLFFSRMPERLAAALSGEKLKGNGGTGDRLRRRAAGAVRAAAPAVLAVLLYNQCADLNRWFYVDDMKYWAAKETAAQVSYELKKNFDLSKPVAFTGIYEIPGEIVKDAYVPYGTPVFFRMNRLAGILDPHILEKFYRDRGVWVAQAPTLSVIEWGRTAFDNNQELANFFEMHGSFFVPVMSLEEINAAQDYALREELPRFPAQGSIVDAGEYIIVNF